MRDESLEREMLAQPVRSLQYMLRRLSETYAFLPEVVEDGIFGEQTLEAVMLFQRELHPPVTGIVDLGTWNAIRDKWQEALSRNPPARVLRLFPERGIQVEPGAEQDVMVLPQAMFQVLSKYFGGLKADVPDGLHGLASVANVKWLQRAAGMKETGIMDQAVWDMLTRLYEVFVVGAPAGPNRGMTGGWG